MNNLIFIWLAIFVITAAGFGVLAAWLGWLGGMTPPMAILTGGGAFSGTIFLLVAVAAFIRGGG